MIGKAWAFWLSSTTATATPLNLIEHEPTRFRYWQDLHYIMNPLSLSVIEARQTCGTKCHGWSEARVAAGVNL
jgi:hypothetical protein